MLDKYLIAKILLVHRLRKRLKRKKRSIYVRSIFLNRNLQGDSILVNELRSDSEYHFKYFRMNKENFDIILAKIQKNIFHINTHARPISSEERLAITLRYLASGNSQISLALAYRVSPSTVCKILRETMAAICESISEYLPNPTAEIWGGNEADFSLKWNFPNACGAIDGKHIRIRAPSASGSSFYNYKNYFSIVLMAIANANYMFTAVDIGSAGSESDGGILMRSKIGKRLFSEKFDLPDPRPLYSNGEKMPHVILGDSGFPLKSYLMIPYKGEFLNQENRIFNYRLSRARMVVENSFGILAARWRIFHSPIDGDIDFIKLITMTCVLLHNFLINTKDFNFMTVDKSENGLLVPGNWRQTTEGDTGMADLPNQGSNNYRRDAAQIRNKFKDYFIGEGKLSWQVNHVSR